MFIDHFGSGGAQRQIVNVAKGLKAFGYHVEFANYYSQYDHFEPEVRQYGIKINSLEKKSKYSLAVIHSVYKLINKGKFDVVISFLNTPNFYAEIACMFTSVKCIVSERSSFSGPISLTRRIQCLFHAFADKIIINSRYHENAIKHEFPYLRKKTLVIYNIVGDDFFSIGERRLASEINNVLCVGTINSNKNCRAIIEALYYIKKIHGKEVKITWAGKTGQSEGDKAYQKYCNELLKKYKLERQWNWAGEVSDIPSLHKKHSVLVHGSFYEGLPNALCEGMASGLIVLASNVNEHPYLLSEIDQELLFNPHNSEELAGRILRVIDLSLEDKQCLIDKIQQRANTLFRQDLIIKKFESEIVG